MLGLTGDIGGPELKIIMGILKYNSRRFICLKKNYAVLAIFKSF